MNDFQLFWNGLDWSVLSDIVLNILPALLCVTLHEICHGYAAWCMGDTTAKDAGRLTLNPLKHLDISGLMMMAVFHIGWAKAVPVNMMRFRKPKQGMALTALAGPACNAVLSAVCLFLYGLLYVPLWDNAVGDFILELLYRTAYLSAALGVFNLLPIPPLDGSKALFSFLSDRAYLKLMIYERYGRYLLIALSFAGLLGKPLGIMTEAVFSRAFRLAEWGFALSKELF